MRTTSINATKPVCPIVDDNVLMRQGIISLLQASQKMEVKEATDASHAMELVREFTPPLVLINLFLDDTNSDAMSLIAQIKHVSPITKVLGYTSTASIFQASEAVRAGVHGYYSTKRGVAELLSAIRVVMRNAKTRYFDESLSDIIDGLLGAQLTPKQMEVLRLIGLGKSNKEIAEALVLEEATIKTHLSKIFQTLNLNSRTKVALFAVTTGLVQPGKVSLALQ